MRRRLAGAPRGNLPSCSNRTATSSSRWVCRIRTAFRCRRPGIDIHIAPVGSNIRRTTNRTAPPASRQPRTRGTRDCWRSCRRTIRRTASAWSSTRRPNTSRSCRTRWRDPFRTRRQADRPRTQRRRPASPRGNRRPERCLRKRRAPRRRRPRALRPCLASSSPLRPRHTRRERSKRAQFGQGVSASAVGSRPPSSKRHTRRAIRRIAMKAHGQRLAPAVPVRAHQTTGTISLSVMLPSLVTSFAPSTTAVATMMRSPGSPASTPRS
jgi:hypothetical protein